MSEEPAAVARRRPRRGRRWLFILASLLLGYGLLETAAAGILYFQFGGPSAVSFSRSIAAAARPDSPDRLDILHPYLGFVRHPSGSQDRGPQHVGEWGFPETRSPLRQRDPSRVIVAVLGGSVAEAFADSPALRLALAQVPRFAGGEIEVVRLALQGYKQPQQLMAIAYLLTLGGEFDVVINLDGFNDVALSAVDNAAEGVFPSYPRMWHFRVRSAHSWEASRMIARTIWSEDRRRDLARWFGTFPLNYSFVAGCLWASWDQQLQRQIVGNIERYQRLLDDEKSPVARGPFETFADDAALYAHCAQVWRNSSLELNTLCAAHGIAYYHFLQPNQYVPDSKPFSWEESVRTINEKHPYRKAVLEGYPLLIEAGKELRAQGVKFADMTRVFADHPEPLYQDDCCHFSAAGNEILARAVGKFIAENP